MLALLCARAAFGLGAVERLADDLSRAGAPTIAALASSATLALAIRASDDPTKKGGRLAATLLPLLEARLGVARRVVTLGATNAAPDRAQEALEGAAITEGAEILLVVELAVSRGYLHAIARATDVRRDFWTRIARPVVGVRSQWYGRARLDGEVRALLGLPAASGRFGLRPLLPCDDVPAGSLIGCVPAGAVLPEPIVAAAVLDLDGDRLYEVALVGLDSVWVGQIVKDERGVDVTVVGSLTLPSGPELGPLPLEPFGFAQAADFDGDGADELVAWSPTRRAAVLVGGTATGVAVRKWPGATKSCGAVRPAGTAIIACGPPLAVWDAAAARSPGEASALPALVTGEVGLGRYTLEPRFRFWSIRADDRSFTTAGPLWAWADTEAFVQGSRVRWTATVDAKGQLAVAGPQKALSLAGAGTAIVFADLDDDGLPELVRSTNADPDMADALIVHALAGTGAGGERYRAPTASVRALAAGDVDNDGRLDVLVVTPLGVQVLSLEPGDGRT